MGTEILSKDYLTLLNEDIPKGRDDLITTSKKLEEVADHCLATYDKSLEQTVNYTAQALGSVAYKINLLATNLLEVLDKQNLKLNGLQTKVNHLNMQVKVHQEKSARLSIGKYTLPRDPNALRPSKNAEPIKELPHRYKRREIDFTILDHVGHGVKETQMVIDSTSYCTSSRRSSGASSEAHSGYNYASNSLGQRSGSEYVARYGRQTIGRTGGLTVQTGTGPGSNIGSSATIYRVPNQLGPNQIVAPPVRPGVVNHASTISNSSSSNAMQMRATPPLNQQPQAMMSPHHRSAVTTSGSSGIGQYGYPGPHNVPPPPPTNMLSQDAAPQKMLRMSQLPSPPTATYQQQLQYTGELPPPPSTNEQPSVAGSQYQYQYQEQQRYTIDSTNNSNNVTVDISHLQPTDKDVQRNKISGDPVWAPAVYICKVVTIYEYRQMKDDELSFNENEVIYVIKKNNDGWWEGVMSSGQGLFPGNYVQVIT